MRLYHFSENATITVFEPHVPATNPTQQAAVWAIDETHSPLYWFPRDCPRATVWARDHEERNRLARIFSTESDRVHATERVWLDSIRTTELHVYELDAERFRPWPDADGQWISTETVEPLSVRPVGDLIRRHVDAGVDLRFVDSVWPFWDDVLESGLPFSGVRLRNARPRRPAHGT